MEMIRLIKGPSAKALETLLMLKNEYTGLRRVTVFFESTNFLITHDQILSENVHLILDFADGKELQIESANCGYGGQGPNTTLGILEAFGVKDEKLADLIYTHDAVAFEVSPESNVQYGTLDMSAIFLPSIRYRQEYPPHEKMVKLDRNVDVSLVNKKVLMYNPQRNSWKGMFNLACFIKNMEFEYYIGDNSPLENRYYIGKGFNKGLHHGIDRPDIEGAEHVNLVLRGDNFRIACLIDRQFEREVIESAFLAFTGYPLSIDHSSTQKGLIERLLKRESTERSEYHEKINIIHFRQRHKGR